MTSSQMVREFHERFGVPLFEKPTVPDWLRRSLRLNLIQEEFNELVEASQKCDIVEVADALADLIYVIHGTAHEWGIPLDKVIEEVHRSNMTKVFPDGSISVREDGKILKPDSYSPPDIRRILAL